MIHILSLIPFMGLFSLLNPTAVAYSTSTSKSGAAMKVDSFSGPITSDEISSFSEFVSTLKPATSNKGNLWSYKDSGSSLRAMGLVYDVTNKSNVSIINTMIRFCDALLSERNDLAKPPVGGYKIWTGRVDPVWPNNLTTGAPTQGEQGECVGNLAYCGYLMVKSTSLHNKTVPDKNPHGYGKTYWERANRYLREAQFTIDQHVLKSQLNISDHQRMYYNPQPGTTIPNGRPVPWNQQMMFNEAFQNLADAYRLLGSNKSLVSKYDNLIKTSIDWFFRGPGGAVSKKSQKGTQVYEWAYGSESPLKHIEKIGHGGADILGMYRAYVHEGYGVTKEMMTGLANTFFDVMTLGDKKWAGDVNGNKKDVKTKIQAVYMVLAEFRSGEYKKAISWWLTEGKTTKDVIAMSNLLWLKSRMGGAKKRDE
ncbi:hypothetical protein F4806DRAFT_501727 [Annulohypoxylon nitens]|nr:hypothetical protein F4806DRAFT_501727 [Annulohypoxylon nitens]